MDGNRRNVEYNSRVLCISYEYKVYEIYTLCLNNIRHYL